MMANILGGCLVLIVASFAFLPVAAAEDDPVGSAGCVANVGWAIVNLSLDQPFDVWAKIPDRADRTVEVHVLLAQGSNEAEDYFAVVSCVDEFVKRVLGCATGPGSGPEDVVECVLNG